MQSLIVPEPVDTAGAAGAASPVVDVVIPVLDEESVRPAASVCCTPT